MQGQEPSCGELGHKLLPRVASFPIVSLQFVLKHEALAHLREVARFPNTLNPHKEESLALVTAMIDQVMELHPGARWFHVGCDEVGASPCQQATPLSLQQPLLFTSRSPAPTSWGLLLNRKVAPGIKKGWLRRCAPVRAVVPADK